MLTSAFSTEKFRLKYEARMARFILLTPGQAAGILRELVDEEREYLAELRNGPDEYDEAMAGADILASLKSDHPR